MDLVCAPVNLFAGILQLSVDLLYFVMGLFGFGAAPNISNTIGSIFGCNV